MIDSSVQEYCFDCSRHAKSYLAAGIALWEYTEEMRRLMAEFKYGGCESDASFFADELMRIQGEKLYSWKIDGIVPVPLHWRKRWFRGYNQAESLAVEIGKRLHVPVWTDVLKRTRYTEPQKELDDKQRFANLRDAFSAGGCGAEEQVYGTTVLLVDDIYTTGATLEACARVLLETGAKTVYFTCLCIGRDY
jgi:ComF family protein